MAINNIPVKMTDQEWAEREQWFKDGYHWCSKCEQKLPISNFNNNKTGRFGLHFWCKCCLSKSRKGNAKHQRIARSYNRQLKSLYKQKLGGKCGKCGYNKTQAALDFHHVSPDDKKFSMAKLIGSNDHPRIMIELDKCILLCRNCHTEFNSFCWSAKFIKIKTGWALEDGTIIENEDDYWTEPSDKILFDQLPIF